MDQKSVLKIKITSYYIDSFNKIGVYWLRGKRQALIAKKKKKKGGRGAIISKSCLLSETLTCGKHFTVFQKYTYRYLHILKWHLMVF